MRPWEILPQPAPRDFNPSKEDPKFFYNNFVKKFIPDMIGIMSAGLHINKEAVEDLRTTVETVLATVDKRLKSNELLIAFQRSRLPAAQKAYADKCIKSIREVSYYIKAYNYKDVVHRTWVVNTYLRSLQKESDTKNRWTLKILKSYNIYLNDAFLDAIIKKRRLTNNTNVLKGMLEFAIYKLELWNRPRFDNANKPVTIPSFNPGSNKQVKEFFEFVKIHPLAFSAKTGEASWGRDQLEIIQKETPEGDLRNVLDAMVDYSTSSIISTNFLKAFDRYTIDGVLHGNLKIFGALSFRPTSQNPNLLNMPSTKSVYAKPLKRCFIAPEGKLIIQADYSSLEDVVLACITLDKGKLDVQRDKTLDAHCYNALTYFEDEIKKVIGNEGSYKDKVRRFKILVKEGNKTLKDIRQKSKPCTFKLAYLGYPDAHKGGVITQEIYDNYHNVLYPGVKSYLDDYTIPTVKSEGYLHLGLGCNLYCNNVEDKFRSLFNANFQFWSILTLISINEMNYRINKEGLNKEIEIVSTIYDSIYTNITADAEIIKWYNDNLVEIGKKDFVIAQEVPNSLTCCIGRNWAEEITIPTEACVSDITEIIKKLV